ncbi:MAG TPA: hypothetical protein VEI97_05380 [bacterium]|nr:hypothetical protein [bacterium]
MDFASTFRQLKPLFEEVDPEFEHADEVGGQGYSDIAQFREGLDREGWGGRLFEQGPAYYEDPESARDHLPTLKPAFEALLRDYDAIIDSLANHADLERLNEILNWAYGITEVYGHLGETH